MTTATTTTAKITTFVTFYPNANRYCMGNILNGKLSNTFSVPAKKVANMQAAIERAAEHGEIVLQVANEDGTFTVVEQF